MDLKLKDKVAIVGGASQGIGFGIARALATEGAKLAITARRELILREACAKILAQTGIQPLALPADCRRAATVPRSWPRPWSIMAPSTFWSTMTARRRSVICSASMT